jgi:hypothetical protein
LRGQLHRYDHRDIEAMIPLCPSLSMLLKSQMLTVQVANDLEEMARPLLAELMSAGLTDVPIDFAWLATVSMIALACAQLGDETHATTLHRMLVPWAADYVDWGPGWLGSVSHYLGLLAAVAGELDAAHEHFQTAIDSNTRAGGPGWQAHAELAWAELLRRDPRPELPEAETLARQALDRARGLSLVGVVEKAERLISDWV